MKKTITKEESDRIWLIFRHLQYVDKVGMQKYDPLEEYRTGIMIGKGLTYSQDAQEVYTNTEKLTPWHKRIWQKRCKEIAHHAFMEHHQDAGIWRLGFRV